MPRLSSHQHTGKRLPHRHTSYGGLLLLLLLVGATITALSIGVAWPGSADSGSIGVTAIVPGPPPATAPTITAPIDGATVHQAQVSVSGQCSNSSYLVALVDNTTPKGSVFCGEDGRFSLNVDLSTGSNRLVAHYIDNLNQSGPDSAPVTVNYVAAPSPVGSPTGSPAASGGSTGQSAASPAGSTGPGAPLNLSAPVHIGSIVSGNAATVNFAITGGTAPYAVAVDWGDSARSLLSRSASGEFTLAHSYERAGHYAIIATVTDITGATAVFQTGLAVTGGGAQPSPTPVVPPVVAPQALTVVWQLFVAICLIVLSFWLGELYDRRRRAASPPLPPAAV